MILKAFKLRFYPTPEQHDLVIKTFGCVRFVWNQRVEGFNSWNPKTPIISEPTIKEMKVTYPWLAAIPYNALEQKLQDWKGNKNQFFNKNRKKKLGRPKFKNRHGRQSFRLSSNGFTCKNNQIHAAKLGALDLVGYDLSTLPLETCKSVTISKDPSGKFFCSLLIEVEVKLKPITGRKVGIDLGLKDLFIFSDGQVISNPKWFRENQSKLKKAQRHLARKQKGSNRRKKQRIKVARIHEKIRFQRNNFLHEVSSALVRDFDVICIEDLNVLGMVKNHRLAKSIHDASWSSFVSMLTYKCQWYGKTLVKIDRFYPSSKTCSSCGFKLETLDLGTREWICPSCGVHHNRDLNAAKNILKKGWVDLVGEEEFGGFPKPSSVEYIENKRGEEVSLFDVSHHLASSLKRLETNLDKVLSI